MKIICWSGKESCAVEADTAVLCGVRCCAAVCGVVVCVCACCAVSCGVWYVWCVVCVRVCAVWCGCGCEVRRGVHGVRSAEYPMPKA
jgi:hypothetical protein